MFVFSDMDDYKQRGSNVDHEYLLWRENQKKNKVAPKKVKSGFVGQTLMHKTNGKGTIKSFDGTIITVRFNNGETKSFNYAICLEKQLIEIG